MVGTIFIRKINAFGRGKLGPAALDSVKIPFKCGADAPCVVKEVISSPDYDLNLKIHILRNCIRCNGSFEPEFDAII